MVITSHLTELLENLGLSKREAEVYLILLELNEALTSVIAKKAGQKRPTCYATLEKLRERGLASSVKKKNLIYFQATKPDHFLEKEQIRAKEVEKSLSTLSTALPELLALHQQFAATPQMSVFYGKEGLIQVMEDTLTTQTELLCWSNIKLNVYSELEDYYPTYIRKKVDRKIWLRGIFLYEKEALEFKKKGEVELREVYLIPREEFFFENEINIYDDKVAITSHRDKIGVIIQNKYIADAHRVMFKLAFERAKELEEKILTKGDKAFLRK